MSFSRKKNIISKEKEENKQLIFVVGPTAVGKTSISIQLAKIFNSEIISADSRQFYSELKIGAAPPDGKELEEVPHHFVGSHHVWNHLSAGEFERLAILKIEELFQTHDTLFVVGGSGLFLEALAFGFDSFPEVSPAIREKLNEIFKEEGIGALQLMLKEMDPDYHAEVDLSNHRRVMRALELCLSTGGAYSSLRSGPQARPFQLKWIGIEMPRDLLYRRIEERVDRMISKGLEKEARGLLKYKEMPALHTVGYSEFFKCFEGEFDQMRAIELIKRNTRRYAKRQLTWFRNKDYIKWFAPDDIEAMIAYVKSGLSKTSS